MGVNFLTQKKECVIIEASKASPTSHLEMQEIGPYKIEGTLGRGGMGTVFRAMHEKTGDLHAVKVLSPVYSNDDHFRGRFESEIKALLKLDHPNIVRLISFGQDDGNLYFSMELIDGSSLFQMQKESHRFNWREILAIAKDVCQGLRHAHDRGIIHRDLKPGNLMMTKSGLCKIADFGIAKSFGSNQNTGDNVLGTMDFMSPEQAKGEPVTFRSDLYSLGTVLYTLLAGRPPFSANSIEESLRNLTRVPAPKISTVVPDTPAEIEKIISRLMEKKPEKRIATALALHHKLSEIEESLKGYSEAKTAESGSKVNTSQKTVNLGPRHSTTESRTSARSNTGADSKFEAKTSAKQKTRAEHTVVESEERSGGLKKRPPSRTTETSRPDFYSQVSDRQRREILDPIDDPEADAQGGLLPTLLALVVVLAMAAVGTWYAMKSPSADELYTTIQSSRPSKVVEEAEKFLAVYPDDERADTVRRIHEFGKATLYYSQLSNRLSVRKDYIGENRLSDIERQFLEIAELSKTEYEEAHMKMKAFVTVHDSVANLSDDDRECLQAAKSFTMKIREDATNHAKTNLLSISSALTKASRSGPRRAAEIYGSIIELYGPMTEGRSNPEVAELVASAKSLLKELESGEKEWPLEGGVIEKDDSSGKSDSPAGTAGDEE